ncbi:Protein of unknown function [Bacillus wiedmannii]|nr:Protein of unknown function [Bacillus wiedmannii]
MVAEGTNIEA